MLRILTVLLFLTWTVAVSAQGGATIQQYLSVKSASSPNLTNDGKSVIYLSNVTGTTQVWSVSVEGGTPRQLTNYDDNIGFVRLSPDGQTVAFGKARGGDENTQLFVMNPDGSGVRQLTDLPRVRHNFGGWSKNGRYLYYASNKRNPQFFDVYRMIVADGREELIYQSDASNSFADADADDRRIIISRSGTELSLDNDLYLYDVAAKKETHLTPHRGSAEFENVNFTSDGLILTQNEAREFMTLSRMTLPSSSQSNFTPDFKPLELARWDVSDVEIHGSKLVYALNREGFSELFVRDLNATNRAKAKSVTLPGRGIVSGVTFSSDGTKLAFAFSAANFNPDIWIYDTKSNSLLQITRSDRAGLDQNTFVRPELIRFRSFDGRYIPAWFYKSEVVADKTVSRTIISVHGGPEGQERPGFNPLYQYYLSRGYNVLATNVRGSTGYGKTFTHLDDVEKREDSVRDLAAAAAWLNSRDAGKTKKLAVMGGSYGGYMTMAAVTLYPELWSAAVNTVGIVNWETFLRNTSGYRRRQREVEYGRLDRNLEFLRSISPIAKVDRIKAPLFVIHGKNDPRVPYTEAEQVVDAMKKRGAVVEYKLFDDEGHGISKLKNRLVLYPLVADFLDRHMK